MSTWQNIYSYFDPIAFRVFGFPVYWYGLMYILALLSAFYIAKYFIKKDGYKFTNKDLDDLFLWEALGVIIGARIMYIIIYDPHTTYYLTQPWQMFNPFVNGEFTGIRGMSYHGGVIGFLVGTYLYVKRYKKSFWHLMDLAALSIPLAYIFGRVGNFLNQELIGRATDLPWGIYVGDILRHPSQLYEAFLEGVVVFVILYWLRRYKTFDGFLIIAYFILYSITRFIAEIYREPDVQLGFYSGWLTMGQILSIIGIVISLIVYGYLRSYNTKK